MLVSSRVLSKWVLADSLSDELFSAVHVHSHFKGQQEILKKTKSKNKKTNNEKDFKFWMRVKWAFMCFLLQAWRSELDQARMVRGYFDCLTFLFLDLLYLYYYPFLQFVFSKRQVTECLPRDHLARTLLYSYYYCFIREGNLFGPLLEFPGCVCV